MCEEDRDPLTVAQVEAVERESEARASALRREAISGMHPVAQVIYEVFMGVRNVIVPLATAVAIMVVALLFCDTVLSVTGHGVLPIFGR